MSVFGTDIILATISVILVGTVGYAAGNLPTSLFIGIWFIFLLACIIFPFCAWLLSVGNMKIAALVNLYIPVVLIVPFVYDMNMDVASYIGLTIGLPIMLPLLLILGYLENAEAENKTDPNRIRIIEENKQKKSKSKGQQNGTNNIGDKKGD